jgi:hypothetical protein
VFPETCGTPAIGFLDIYDVFVGEYDKMPYFARF